MSAPVFNGRKWLEELFLSREKKERRPLSSSCFLVTYSSDKNILHHAWEPLDIPEGHDDFWEQENILERTSKARG